MNTLTLAKWDNRKEKATVIAFYALCVLSVAIVLAWVFNPAFADTATDSVIKLVKNLGAIVCYVLGAIYLISGFIKYASAHADSNGMEEKKAATTLAAAIILIVVGTVLISLDLSFISSNIDKAQNNLKK